MAEAAGAWRVLAASLAGTSHIATGLPCQDAHGWRELPGGLLIAAVADGAGSASRSDEGAAIAVEAALDELTARLIAGDVDCGPEPGQGPDPDLDLDQASSAVALRAAFAAAREALLARAAAEGFPARDLACTLALAVVDAQALTAAQVGDGAVLARHADGTWQSLLEPQKGEYANEVLLLIAPEALQRMSLAQVPAPEAMVLSTDGLIRLMLRLPGGEPHPAFLDPLVAFARQAADLAAARRGLRSFLGSERVCGRTDDDKTLLIALPPAARSGASAAGEPPTGAPPIGEPPAGNPMTGDPPAGDPPAGT